MSNCRLADCSGDDGPGFTCNYCDRTHCSDHRLPENHACPSLAYSERKGKRLEDWHDTLERDDSPGVVTRTKRALLGRDPTDSPTTTPPPTTDAGEDRDEFGDPSPDVAPDGSLKRDHDQPTQTADTSQSMRITAYLRRVKQVFVNPMR